MKKLYSLFVLATVLFAAACEKADDSSAIASASSELSVNVAVAGSGTKTVLNAADLIKWDASDAKKMGIWLVAPTAEYTYNTFIASASAEFSEDYASATFKFADSSTNYKEVTPKRLFYPYFSSPTPTRYNIVMTVPTEQKQTAAGENKFGSESVPMVSDFVVAENAEVDGLNVTYGAKMHVLSSIIAFYVYDSAGAYAAEKVESITLASTSDAFVAGATNIAKVNEGHFADESEPECTLVGDSKSAVVTLTEKFALDGVASKSASAPIYLSIVPGAFEGKITVRTDKAIYIFPFAAAKTFAKAEVCEFSLNLSNEKAQRTALADMPKPVVKITHLSRKASGSTNTAAITVKKGNDAAVGFYACIMPKANGSDITKSEILSKGELFMFDSDSNSDSFTVKSDGSVVYTQKVNLYSPSVFAFAAMAVDAYGNYGNLIGDNGYGNSTRETDLNL